MSSEIPSQQALSEVPSTADFTDVADEILVARASDGDTAAFAALLRRYSPMMRAYARSLLASNAELDDVVQEASLAAWRALPSLERADRVRSWLMRMTGRKAIDRLRRGKDHLEFDEREVQAAETHDPSIQYEVREGFRALAEALAELPEVQRECWVLKEFGDYRYEDIAEELGVTAATVRGALARARRFLVTRMEVWR